MSGVKRPRRKLPTAPIKPNLPDRPGRWKLLLRRRRNLMRPLALAAVLGMVGIGAAGTIQGMGTGTNWTEKLGSLTARAGLTVQNVVVEGRQKTPEPLLRAAIGVAPGDAILTIGLADMRTRIESINWVQTATVERRLPGTLVVRLQERSPFAVWQKDGVFRLIDRKGEVVSDINVTAFSGQLPLVVGAGADKAATDLIDALAKEPTIQPRVAAAVRIGDRRWNLRMTNGADILLPEGAEAAALARLAELQASNQLLDRPIALIDLRQPDRFVFRPATEKPAEKPIPIQAKKT